MKVTVKWSKQKFADLDLDPSAPTLDFKGLLFSLTSVEPERQKIMVKGGIVKDEPDWSKYKLKEGMMIMMMGTPSGKEVKAPEVATKFIEDEDSGGVAGEDFMPPGLTNISNTCYMNSVVQTLGASKELKTALERYVPAGEDSVAGHLSKLYSDCAREGTTQVPEKFWTSLRTTFRQFDERAANGRAWAQQDADECWEAVMRSVSDATAGGPGAPAIENLFYGQSEVVLQCEEDAEEPPTTSSEKFSKLKVTLNPATTHISIGLRNGVEAQVEKRSEKLGRDALYKKTTKISKLPYYMTVQFVRFEFVQHSQQNTKILRTCNFDMSLDVLDLCNDELKEQLKIVRKKLKDAEDKRLKLGKWAFQDKKQETAAEKMAKEQAARKALEGGDMLSPGGTRTMEVDGEMEPEPAGEADGAPEAKRTRPTAEDGSAAAAAAEPESEEGAGGAADGAAAMDEGEEEEEGNFVLPPQDPDMPVNRTGAYELCAILTHKGPTADGGHYVSFVRQKDNDVWCCFDDDKVTECRGSELPRKLDGGTAHNHMAYVLLYRSKDQIGSDQTKGRMDKH